MLPFTISLRAGQPIFEQVVYAVARAIATGQLQPGDAFPSVRTLSQELKINPNTGQKIVAALAEQGLLVVRPGIGTIVGGPKGGGAAAKQNILEADAERLVVKAKHAGLSLEHLLQAIRRHWREMQ
jgi:GntR family transcriptional regulator